ncbi:hypothetical protein C0991_005033 [Blastosporella zonata]|nr:hypothetical protein C0991_005033 [Blastosporella zonata]
MPAAQEIKSFPWDKVDWLIVNEGEAEGLYHTLSSIESSTGHTGTPKEILSLLSARPELQKTNIICTLGKDGVMAFIPTFHQQGSSEHDSFSFLHIPAAVLQGTVRDTTGAGDCFTGYFVQGLMEFGSQAVPGRGIEERDVENILKTCVQVCKTSWIFFANRDR